MTTKKINYATRYIIVPLPKEDCTAEVSITTTKKVGLWGGTKKETDTFALDRKDCPAKNNLKDAMAAAMFDADYVNATDKPADRPAVYDSMAAVAFNAFMAYTESLSD